MDHERRHFPVGVQPRAEIRGVPAPRDLQLLDVVLSDLIERRILRAVGVAPIEMPLAGR